MVQREHHRGVREVDQFRAAPTDWFLRLGRRHRVQSWFVQQILACLCLAALPMATTSCGALDPSPLPSLFEQSVNDPFGPASINRACGPIAVAPIIPDCPLDLVCFTPACELHNACYGRCDATKAGCDSAFLEDLMTICTRRFLFDGGDRRTCQTLAVTYWLAVATLGKGAFESTQEEACFDTEFPPSTAGVCCRPDESCDDSGSQGDCDGSEDTFFPGAECEGFECDAPVNDDCDDAPTICQNIDPNDDGQCLGDHQQSCSVEEQNCPDLTECAAEPAGEVSCIVETDNRLATTDGTKAEGSCLQSGEDSFQADVWFDYVAPCSGRLTIRMCGQPNYDAMLAVYGTHDPNGVCACPDDNGSLLECDDDFCAGGSVSAVFVDGVVENACYKIRVGGWSSEGTADNARQGQSELDIVMRCDRVEADQQVKKAQTVSGDESIDSAEER